MRALPLLDDINRNDVFLSRAAAARAVLSVRRRSRRNQWMAGDMGFQAYVRRTRGDARNAGERERI